MLNGDRNSLRRSYQTAWRKHREKLPMEPLEIQIADVVGLHPEYHSIIEAVEVSDMDFDGDDGCSNPFLHMGLHLAIRDQAATDRPPGFAAEYRRLAAETGGIHEAEHLIMEVLAESLWEAQQSGREPDESAYLHGIRQIGSKTSRG